METHQLVAHPAHPPLAVSGVEARVIGRDANWLRLRWRVEGVGRLIVPPFAGRGREDGLWQTTCFEAFMPVGSSDCGYLELNLSPSERWNLYSFSAYREGMAEAPLLREPDCTMRIGSSFAIFDAAIPSSGLPIAGELGLCAVIEEEGGVKSYWALAHMGEAPDFHDPACFTARLPAARAT